MIKVQCSKYPQEKCEYCEKRIFLMCDMCKFNMYQSLNGFKMDKDFFMKVK